MNIEVTQLTPWSLALDMARQTVNKKPLHKEPSEEWKEMMLRAEHSPIRCVQYLITLKDVPYWVANHFTRHHLGIEKFVCTQRSDRTGIDRRNLPQDAPVDCSFIANAQALINISRVRLCAKAAQETRIIWGEVKTAVGEIDKTMAKFMVQNCIYRGFCPEKECCGFCNGGYYKEYLKEYRNGTRPKNKATK